jgi:hypothetical protein
MKNLVKARNRNGEGFRCLQQKCPRISGTKIKEGIIGGTRINLMNDRNFDGVLEGTEKTEREAFKLVADKFVVSHKAPNYRQLVAQVFEAYRMVGSNMLLKIHFILTWISFQQTLGK